MFPAGLIRRRIFKYRARRPLRAVTKGYLKLFVKIVKVRELNMRMIVRLYVTMMIWSIGYLTGCRVILVTPRSESEQAQDRSNHLRRVTRDE